MMLLAQLDLAAGKQEYRQNIFDDAMRYPNSRAAWILLDAYNRQQSRPDAVDFYFALMWLYPDDEWAMDAAQKGIGRSASPKLANVESIEGVMKDYPPRRWRPDDGTATPAQIEKIRNELAPWTAASAVCQLAARNDFKAARALALRYCYVCGFSNASDLCVWANHLVYKVDESEKIARKNRL